MANGTHHDKEEGGCGSGSASGMSQESELLQAAAQTALKLETLALNDTALLIAQALVNRNGAKAATLSLRVASRVGAGAHVPPRRVVPARSRPAPGRLTRGHAWHRCGRRTLMKRSAGGCSD